MDPVQGPASGPQPFKLPKNDATPGNLFPYSEVSGFYVGQHDYTTSLVYVAVKVNKASTSSQGPYSSYGWTWRPGHGESGRYEVEDTYFLFSANHRAACKGAIDAMSYDYAKWGFKGVVIATDDFSLLNTLIRLEAWKGWGWKTGPDAKSVVCGNKDLLMELDEKLKKQREQGVQIYFWDIKQEQNLANDLATKG